MKAIFKIQKNCSTWDFVNLPNYANLSFFNNIGFKYLKILFIVLFIGVFSSIFQSQNAHAGVFSITNRNYGNASDPTVISQINAAFDALQNQVNSKLTVFDTSSYLTGVANSTPIASSGFSEDHASRFKYFFISITGGIAADLGGTSLNSIANGSTNISDFKGLTGAYQFTFGTKASYFNIPKWQFIDPDQMKLYLGVAQTNLSRDNVDFSFESYSLTAQQHFLTDLKYAWGTFAWNGLLVSTGFKYSRLNVSYSKSFAASTQQNLSAPGNPTLTLNFNNTVNLGAKSTITSIPIDVSSSVSVMYLFDLYAGLGTDLNFGSTQSIINAPGTLSGTESSGTLGTMSGNINIDLGDKKSPQFFDGRYYIGGALDLRVLSLGLQYTKAVTNNSQGISFQLAAHF